MYFDYEEENHDDRECEANTLRNYLQYSEHYSSDESDIMAHLWEQD